MERSPPAPSRSFSTAGDTMVRSRNRRNPRPRPSTRRGTSLCGSSARGCPPQHAGVAGPRCRRCERSRLQASVPPQHHHDRADAALDRLVGRGTESTPPRGANTRPEPLPLDVRYGGLDRYVRRKERRAHAFHARLPREHLGIVAGARQRRLGADAVAAGLERVAAFEPRTGWQNP